MNADFSSNLLFHRFHAPGDWRGEVVYAHGELAGISIHVDPLLGSVAGAPDETRTFAVLHSGGDIDIEIAPGEGWNAQYGAYGVERCSGHALALDGGRRR